MSWDKNLTKSVQKYLKITHEDFCKACEISHKVWNSFSLALVLQGLWNFASLLKSIFHRLTLCPTTCIPFGIWHSHAKLLDVRFLLWFSSLHTWLIWKRLRSSSKLGFFVCLSFNLLFIGAKLLFLKKLESPLILVFFLNEKQNKKEILVWLLIWKRHVCQNKV